MFFAIELNADSQSQRPPTVKTFGGPCAFEVDGGVWRCLVGRVYLASENLKEISDALLQADGDLPGRYVFLEFNFASRQLQIWQDRYRLLSPLLYSRGADFWLGNVLSHLPTDMSREMDEESVASLRMHGAVLFPATLYKHLKLLAGSANIDFRRDSVVIEDHALRWPAAEEEPVTVEEWALILKAALSDIHRFWSPEILRMSGGIDTRLLAHLIPGELKKTLKAEVFNHPDLKADEDRDVLGARETAAMAGLSLSVVKSSHQVYFSQESWTPILDGLYGGEFLGGVHPRFSPWLESQTLLPAWQERLNRIGAKRLSYEQFLSSFRSVIYKSVSQSWASPRLLNLVCLSPYTERSVLDRLLQTSQAALTDYRLYGQLAHFVLGKNVLKPLCSPIVGFGEGFVPFDHGRDPKGLRSPTEFVQAGADIRELNLANFLSSHRQN